MTGSNIGKISKVACGVLRKVLLDLIRGNGPRRSCELCEQGRVIAGPRSYVNNRFPFLHIKSCEAKGMESRLPIVDFAFGCEAHNHVLIQESGVGGWRLDVTTESKYLPWPGAYEALPSGRCKGGREPTILLRHSRSGGD